MNLLENIEATIERMRKTAPMERIRILVHPEKIEKLLEKLGVQPGTIEWHSRILTYAPGIEIIPCKTLSDLKSFARSSLERLTNYSSWLALRKVLFSLDFSWADWWEIFEPARATNLIRVPRDEVIVMKSQPELFLQPSPLKLSEAKDFSDRILYKIRSMGIPPQYLEPRFYTFSC